MQINFIFCRTSLNIIYRFVFLSLAVALFDTRCSIVYKFSFLSRTTDSFNILHFCRTMLKFLWNLHFCRYAGCCIDCVFTLQFQYFLCIYIFAARCRIFCEIYIFAAGCYIDCAFTFLPLHLLLQLHCLYIYIFAGCFALLTNLHFCRLLLLYILPLAFALLTCFFLFCKFVFCRLLLHCLRIYIFVAHYCILLEQTIDYITEALRPQGKNMLELPNHPMGANIRLKLY